MSIYALKPRFQALLRPAVGRLAAAGVTANGVTTAAMLASVAVGGALCVLPRRWFWLLPGWMLLRMAANAVDGMLAREFGQKSALGAFLNELSDVISDAALYLPFAFVPPFDWRPVGAVIVLSVVGEMAGVVAQAAGASRRYDGPMGKSDRAFAFALLAVWIASTGELPRFAAWAMWGIAVLAAATIANRVRAGLREIAAGTAA